MDEIKQEIKRYNYYVLDDFFFFSKDIKHSLKEFDLDYITSVDHLNFLLEIIDDLKTNQIYPEFCLNNMAKLIGYLSENIKENDEFYEYKMNLINKMAQIYLEIKEINSNEIYNLEYESKYSDRYLINEPIFISKELMENSIRYDLIAMSSFNETEDVFNQGKDPKYLTDLYLLSIKKMIFYNPDFFKNKSIKKRALCILNNNLDEAKNNNKDTSEYEKIINKLNQKSIDNSYMDSNIIYSYYVALIKNMAIKEIDKPDLINEDLLSVAYELTETTYLYDEKMRDVILDIMHANINHYRTLFKDDKDKLKNILLVYNQYLGHINKNKNNYETDLFESEIIYLSSFWEYILYHRLSDFVELDEDIRKSICTDYHLIKSLISSEEEFEKFKNEYVESDLTLVSIKKLLNSNQLLFDNNVLNARIKDILINHINNKESKKIMKKIKNYNY